MLSEVASPRTAKSTPRQRAPRQRAASDDGVKVPALPVTENGTSSSTVNGNSKALEKSHSLSVLEEDEMDLSTAPSKEEKSHDLNGVNCIPEERRKQIGKGLRTVEKRVPGAKKMMDIINMMPPRVRVILLSLWLLWKVVIAVMFLHVILFTTSQLTEGSSQDSSTATSRFARELGGGGSSNSNNKPRILYIVTTLAEYNNGKRQTEKGQDRLGEVLIPILVDSVESMVHEPFNYHVDVFLIAAFKLRPERERYIRQRLPDGVGLQVWDEACPLGYEVKHGDKKVIDNTRALARQHRYVVKDKLLYYDLFLAFEDDMRLTGDHVSHFMEMSAEIEKLRVEAPATIPNQTPNRDPRTMNYFGPLTLGQMDRLVPGFIRVEVLLDEKENGAQTELHNIGRDYQFQVSDKGKLVNKEVHFNSRICCHVQMKPNKNTPVHPPPQDVIIWETNIQALSALKMPKPKVGKPSDLVDWVGVLPGPGKKLDPMLWIGGYWSGRDGAFGDIDKPSGGRPDIIAQQGGWMATRQQLLRMNNEGLCMGSYLPPFDEPMYRKDGQESFNVEFWSGGYQFFTGVRGGCNMQRIFSLHPDYYSNHFIYHVANNKQKQLNQERMLRADNLLGQLNTVRKTAERALLKETGPNR